MSLPFPSMWSTLQVLKNAGFNPKTCIDVGAYKGRWTQNFRTIFPECKVLMIDALGSVQADLEKVAKESGGMAVAEESLLWIAPNYTLGFIEMETGSSVREEQSYFPRTRRRLGTTTLDRLTSQHHPDFQSPDFIKIDTQGSELEILSGASSVMKSVQAILVEASLVPINSGCPNIAKVIWEIGEYFDMSLYDICSQTRRADGVLWQTDLMFVRSDSGLLPEPKLTLETWGPNAVVLH